ncbi:hypothetical protein TVAG_268870 [Trichomonas vaginalis G3]|uniref:Uncharacterized protein n=1 Tax=Trichomonas vaginalis (strain ATCC PRA-98 / G3) TaxID=412133 RepID=A2FIX3_TRIV3|nr:VPS9 domain family [Trichomonas vaginalis G3]EAX95150.1 hypothetical protein TVAG_268870 [Trichomonas vaginalis G3]KAI5515241.1 VPS9 domain family [Trichomonas vaginalis G3]|eukprot:XP_001308080.1 hypothetical protein [Trichomonas vaginalis G3]
MNEIEEVFVGFEEFRQYFVITKDKKDSTEAFFQSTSYFTNFYNFVFLINHPKKLNADLNHLMLTGDALLRFHELKFLEDELYNLELEKYHENEKKYSKFIDLLGKLMDYAQDNFIQVNVEEFQKDTTDFPNKKRITSYIQIITNSLSISPVDNRNKQQIKKEIQRLLKNFAKDVGNSTIFAPVHPSEPYLMALLTLPCLPYKEILDNVINVYETTDAQVFSLELYESIYQIIKDLKLEKPKDSILFICIYRYIYETIFIRFPQTLAFKIDYTQAKALEQLKICDLQMIPPYKPECDEQLHPRDVFPLIEDFKDAVSSLQKLYFVVCPFDILDCVNDAITSIEKGCSRLCNYTETVFSFDTIFILFLACILASEIYDIDSMSKLCMDFIPVNKLAPKFEYAKAKIFAVAEELKRISQCKQ